MAKGWNVMDALKENGKEERRDEPKASFRTKNISIKDIYPSEENALSMPNIREMADNILAVGLLENLVVTYAPCEKGEYRLISGERRWRALTMLTDEGYKDFETVSCQIMTPEGAGEEAIERIIANSYRSLTVADIIKQEEWLKRELQYMKENNIPLRGRDLREGKLREVIARMMGTSSTRVAQIEAIAKNLLPEFLEEMKNEHITFSAAYELSGMTKEEQQGLLAQYQKSGLTHKEIKEMKKQKKDQGTEEADEKKEAAAAGENTETRNEKTGSTAGTQGHSKGMDGKTPAGAREEPGEPGEPIEEEWQQAHPESITSLCYSCKRYSDCNVKTGTCKACDRYVNKAAAEKTEEQKYNEQQAQIDRETRKKLREMDQEKKMSQLPLDRKLGEPKTYKIKLAAGFYEDVAAERKTFELRKNDRNYRVGDILELMEYMNGRETGRILKAQITYKLEDYTGLVEGYCILGIKLIK